MTMTEEQIGLVTSAKNGDLRSFEQLYTIYYEKVYGFARMILRNETDAEDVLQETFVTAWRKLDTLETPAAFSVWIQIIAKNLCNMQLRRKNIAILLDADQDIENFDAEDSDDFLPAIYNERADLKERLGRIIDDLSDVQRQTIVLYYFNELSVDEISDVMQCSPGTVKSRLFLARNAIKAEVEEQERKAGQKFYGAIGIPTLPFGELIKANIEAVSLGQSAGTASFNVITKTISGSEIKTAQAANKATNTAGKQAIDAAQGSAQGTEQAAATAVTKTTMSLQAKIVAIIAIVAAAAAAVVLIVILSGGGLASPGTGGQDIDQDIVISDAAGEETEAEGIPDSGEESSASDSQPPAPAQTPEKTETAAAQPETTFAYIKGISANADGTLTITLEFHEWLSGEEAVAAYMNDNPGVSRQDAEMDTEAYGYIRQSLPGTHPLTATADTKFFILDESAGWKTVELDLAAYKNFMIPAVEKNETIKLFAKVIFSGEKIIQIGMEYRP